MNFIQTTLFSAVRTYLVQLKAGMAYPLSFACFRSLTTSSPVITPTGTSQGVTILFWMMDVLLLEDPNNIMRNYGRNAVHAWLAVM